MAKGEANLTIGKRRNTSFSKRKSKQKKHKKQKKTHHICVCGNDSIGNIDSDAGFVTQAVMFHGKKREEILAEMIGRPEEKWGSVSLDRCGSGGRKEQNERGE